jgi:predicted DNA-binding protein with PD1-like motif
VAANLFDGVLVVKSNLKVHVLRLVPGDDPKIKLHSYVRENNLQAVIVLAAVGSLTRAVIRFVDKPTGSVLEGSFEIVSLSGTLDLKKVHLHISISDSEGKTLGGHLMDGSKIHTTLEIALGEITDLEFLREPDPITTFDELKVSVRKL